MSDSRCPRRFRSVCVYEHSRPKDSISRGVKSYPPGARKAYLANFFAARVSAAEPAVAAACTTYVSTQQCVTEKSESRRRSCRAHTIPALSPAEVTGLDTATLEHSGSRQVVTPADVV